MLFVHAHTHTLKTDASGRVVYPNTERAVTGSVSEREILIGRDLATAHHLAVPDDVITESNISLTVYPMLSFYRRNV